MKFKDKIQIFNKKSKLRKELDLLISNLPNSNIIAKDLLEEEKQLEQDVKELFDKIDTDHSNEIDRKEFRAFIQNLYGRSGKKVSSQTIDKFIKNLDKDKSGTISLDEFREYAIKVLHYLSKEEK